MALNVDKNRQVAGYTETPPTTATKAGGTSASSAAIDFSTAAGSVNGVYKIKQGDTLQTIAIQLLIASGNTNPTPEQITEIMQKIATVNGCTSIDDFNTKFINNIGADLNLQGIIEVKQPEEPTEAEPETLNPSVPQSEMEELALKIGNGKRIDDVIAEIRAKQLQGDNLSDDELKLITLYDENIKQPETKEKTSDANLIMSYKELLSDDFSKLSSKEKMAAITEKYLEKSNPDFAEMSEDEKKQYVNKTMQEIVLIANNGKAPATEKEAAKAGMKALALMQTAYSNNMTVQELSQSPDRDKLVSTTTNQVLKGVFDLVSAEDRKGKTNLEIAHMYADKMLLMTDPEYAALQDEDQKKEYRMKKIETMIANYDKNSDFSELSPEEKELRIGEMLSVMQYTVEKNKEANGDINIEDIFKMDQIASLDKLEGYNEYLSELPDSKEKEGLLARNNARIIVVQRLHEKGIDNPNPLQIKEELDLMAEEQGGEIKDPILNSMHQELIRKAERGRLDKFNIHEETNADYALKLNMELEEYIRDSLNGLKNADQEEKEEALQQLIKHTNGDPHELRLIADIAKSELNITESQWHSILQASGESMEQLWDKAIAAEDFNWAIDNDTNTERVGEMVSNVPKWYGNDQVALDNIGVHVIQDRTEYVDALTQGMHEYGTIENNTAFWERISNSGKVADANLAKGIDNFMKNATSDEDRVSYSKSLTDIGNVVITEGVAASAKYVSDPAAKTTYTENVTTAAQSYPPEQQKTINTAMQTGQISNETLSRTSPAPSTSSTTSSGSTGSTGSSSSAYTNNYTPRNYAGTTSSTPNTTSTSSAYTPTSTGTTSTGSYTTTPTVGSTTTQSSTFASIARGYTPTSQADATAAAEQKRQAAMDNALETAKSIEEAVDIWNKTHPKQLTIDEIDAVKAATAVEVAREAVESAAVSESEKERILTALSNAKSISEVYDILVSALGVSRVQDKFIEILASRGSTANIKAFIASRAGDNDTLVKQIFLRTTSTSLKKELLGMMSPDTIAELLSNNQITDLSYVDQSVLINYVMRNLYSMSNSVFARFLNAIADPSEKNRLIEMRTNLRNHNNAQNPVPAIVESAGTSDAPSVQPAPQAYSFAPSETPIAPETLATTPQDGTTPDNTQAPKLAKNEISKELPDGTILTREGAGFGAVSNTDYDLARVAEKPKEGDPIGMEDKTYTVGSAEWNRKYNRDNTPTTAFTMKALDEDDMFDFGGIWSGNKGNFKGKPIKKNGLRFNA